MAFITGRIVADNSGGSWVVKFVPQETPGVVGGFVIVANDKAVVTDSDGDLPAGLELIEGRYTVQVNNGEEFEIDVPAGDDAFDIADLFVSEGSASVTRYQISGHGSPEGARKGEPGWFYTDLDTGILWRKISGTGTTGWEQLIA